MIWAVACIAAALITLTADAYAHPDDEFCAFDSGIDPALCRALAEVDADGSIGGADFTIESDATNFEVFLDFIGIGFVHILPLGYDHILFVLALFLAASKMRDLLWQISLFTVAHTLTLGLGAADIVSAPAHIVEPLIAASIVVLALEALFQRPASSWRLALIFGFGLFHGLGFAGQLKEQLVGAYFLPALLGFNVGVEIGQLTVLALAAAILSAAVFAVRRLSADATTYAIAQPSALVIAAIGTYWTLERVLPFAG